MCSRYGLLSFCLCIVVSCTPKTVIKEVKVPVYVPPKIDKTLFIPFPIEEPNNRTVKEALRVAKERKNTIGLCNARLDCIWENLHGRQCNPKP